MKNETVYVIVATNIHGVDETPVVTKSADTADKKMKELLLWGIDNRSNVFVESFDDECAYNYKNTSEIVADGKLDEFLNWLSKQEYVEIEPTRMLIPIDLEDPLDNFEVNIFTATIFD